MAIDPGRVGAITPQDQNFGFQAPREMFGVPVSALTGGSKSKFDMISIANFMKGQFDPQGAGALGNGVAESNFNLNKSVGLRSLALQRQELQRQQSAGLRDIEQSRVEGLRAAVNNALQRGIFNSGVREQMEARVERESGEAAGDLKSRIRIALAQIANQRRGVAGRKFDDGSGGAAGGADTLTPEQIREISARARELSTAELANLRGAGS